MLLLIVNDLIRTKNHLHTLYQRSERFAFRTLILYSDIKPISMKNTIFLISTFLFFFISSSQGQSIEELADEAADGLCNCVNEAYGDIDNDVKGVLAKVIDYQTKDDQEGMANYMANLSADLMLRMEKQASIFQENEALFQTCLQDMDEEMGALVFEEGDLEGITEKEFIAMMLESMRGMEDCQFAYIIMKLGLEMAAEENGDQVESQPVQPKSKKNSKEGTNKYEGTGGN